MNLGEIRGLVVEATGRADLGASGVGGELVYNPSFEHSPYGWDLTVGWSYSAGAVAHNSDGTTLLSQLGGWINITDGYYYMTSFTCTITAGSVRIGLGDGTTATSLGTARTTSGTYVENIMCTYPEQLVFVPSNNFRGSISEVSVRSLTSGYHESTLAVAGMDKYINMAILFLDDSSRTPKGKARYLRDIVVDQYVLTFTYCRSIDEVYVYNSSGEKSKLDEEDFLVLREKYSDAYEDITTDTPLYYCPISIGLSPQQGSLTALTYTTQFTKGVGEITFGDHYAYNGILFLPPADAIYTMEIFGNFYSKTLLDDIDTNFWTEMYPQAVVMATAWHLETFYRNIEGARDWMASLAVVLNGITNNVVEQAHRHVRNVR